jgi:creatinine amidohydrolase/Fe(II)-dependent formamide hydrolase-like protein
VTCRVHFASYWDLMGDAAAGVLTSDSGIGHAAELETSIALTLDGHVRPDRIPASGEPYRVPLGHAGVYRPVRIDPAESNGVVGDPGPASRDAGEKLLELAVSGLQAYCRSLLEAQDTEGAR